MAILGRAHIEQSLLPTRSCSLTSMLPSLTSVRSTPRLVYGILVMPPAVSKRPLVGDYLRPRAVKDQYCVVNVRIDRVIICLAARAYLYGS